MAKSERIEELVVGLYDRDFLQISTQNEFSLNSGRETPIFYKADELTSFSDGLVIRSNEIPINRQKKILKLAVNATCEVVQQVNMPFVHLIGLPESSTVLGALVASELGKSYIWLRVNPNKTRTHQKPVAGNYNQGDRVLYLDNALTTGGEYLRTVAKLEKNRDLLSLGLVAMLDREEGGTNTLWANGHDAYSVFGLHDAVDILARAGRLSRKQLDAVQQYHDKLRADGINSTYTHST